MAKVRIKKAGSMINGYNQMAPSYMPNDLADKKIDVRKSLTPIDPKFANIEAEKGETLLDLDVDGLPAHYKIEGKKHSQGGTPLSTNDHSFIFSADKALKIKDPYLLAEFGKLSKNAKAKNGGELPADIAKQYDINKYRKILSDPNSDKVERETAEQMIKNYNLKLSKLALVQESMKGFPDGIPDAGLTYIAMAGINPQDLLPIDATKTTPASQESSMKMSMGTPKAPDGGDTDSKKKKPTLPKDAIVLDEVANEDEATLNARIDQAWKTNPNKPIYVVKKGQYVPLVTRTGSLVTTSKSGMEGYGTFGNYEQDLKKGNDLFQKMVDNDLAYYDNKAKGWKIKGKASTSDLLTLDDRDVLTRLANSSGEGLGWEGKPIILQHGKDNPYGMYGWANPDVLEYKYWKSINEGKGDTNTFEQLGPDDRKKNRAEMIDFYMKNDKFNPNFKGAEAEYGDILNDPNKLYSSDSPLMKGKFNLVSGIQTVFGEEGSYYPGEGKDYKIGTEHLKEFRKERPWQLGDPLPDEQQNLIQPDPLKVPAQQHKDAPWWLQDTTEIFGRAGDFATIKKYLPWAPKLFPKTMDPTFYDPTRELGQQKEDAAMAYEAAKAFGQGPQALGARSASIQGAEAKAAADTLSKYNNLNVGVDNQTKQINLGIINQYGMANAQLSQDLFDKTTIANQQYDNAKREASTALREAFKTGLTNRAKAQALNTIYPNYQVDPATGGFVNFTPDPNKKLKASPGSYSNPNLDAYLQAIQSNPDIDPDTITKFFGVNSNLQKDVDVNPDADYLNMYNVVTPGNYP